MADPDHHQCDEEEFFSVWAIPPDDLRNKLKTLMTTLRSEFGGAEFEPHVTVVRALRLRAADALRRLRSAVSSLNYYSARVSSISRGSCVSLLLDPTPEVLPLLLIFSSFSDSISESLNRLWFFVLV